MRNVYKEWKKLLIAPVIAILCMFISADLVSAGNTLVGWYVVIDRPSNSLIGYVVDDDTGGLKKVEESYSTGVETNCSQIIVDPNTITASKIGNPKPVGGCEVKQATGSVRTYYAWTWPPTKNIDAGAKDKEMATWANETLVQGFNLAIQKILNENDIYDFADASGFPKFINQLASDATSPGAKSQTLKVRDGKNTKNVTVRYTISRPTANFLEDNGYSVTGGNVNGEPDWGVDSFVKITTPQDKTGIIVPYQVPKGYASGQRLAGFTGDNKIYEPRYIGWSHMAYQASYSALVAGIDSANTDEIFPTSSIEDAFVGFLNKIINGISGILGLYSIEDLTLNRGIRSVTYYKGIMPYSWFSGAALIYWIFQISGIFIIAGGFIRLMIEKNLSVVNPGKRVEIMDGITKIIFAAGMMLLFIPFFTLLATLNELAISTLSSLVPENASLSLTIGAGNGAIIGLIIQFAFIFILLKVNITYVVRAITIAILYGTAPWFIANYTLGETGKNRFQIWLKELTVNIFMQLFNAIMTVLFLTTLRYTSLKVVEQFTLLLSYIALSDYFRGTLMDARSGADGIDDKAASSLGTMGGTLLAGAIGGSMSGFFGRGRSSAYKSSSSDYSSKDGDFMSDTSYSRQTRDQQVAFNSANEPERGIVGSIKHAGKVFGNKLNDVPGVGTASKAAGWAGRGVVAAGRAASPAGKVLKEGFKTAALAGTTLGMETIGANSFEARRRLANSTAQLGQSIGSMITDTPSAFETAYNDFIDGDTAEREMQFSGADMQKGFGILDMKKSKNNESHYSSMDLNGEMTGEKGDGSESLFNDDEEYVETIFDRNSAAFQHLNSDDTRAQAIAGMRDMLTRENELNAEKGYDDSKMELLVDKKGDITGYRTSIRPDTKISSYGIGKNKKNIKVGGKTYANPENVNYRVKGHMVMNANNFVNNAVGRNKRLHPDSNYSGISKNNSDDN